MGISIKSNGKIMNKEINRKLLNKWGQVELSHCPQFILDTVGRNKIQQQLREQVALNLSYCTDERFAQSNFDFCKIEGATPADFKYRLIKTPFGEIITSIRFIGGDLSKPAVFLIHKDFELDYVQKIRQVGQIVGEEYAVFKPPRFRWFSPKIETELIKSNAFISGDSIYVTHFLDYLKQQPLPPNYDKVQLELATSINWYEEYKTTYETIYKHWPASREMTRIESQTSLQEIIEKKLLFEIKIENHWAGIIGVTQTSDKFLAGYCVYEELLTEDFRGKLLASAVQRRLIENLPTTQDAMLFGTIHYGNIPSLRTAYKVGRQSAGMYVFAEIGTAN